LNKVVFSLAVILSAGLVLAQDNVPPPPGNTAPPLLQRPYEAARDFFNYYALANVVYDTNGYYVTNNQSPGSSTGMELGGGISGYHQWRTSELSLSYRGLYRSYFSNSYADGNNQSLVADFQKSWKHWKIQFDEAGGILFNQGSVYGSAAPSITNPGVIVQANAFSTESRFSSSTASLTYIKSLRWSFTGTGSFLIDRFNSGYSVGYNDTTGQFTTNYRLTKRTTIGGSFSHSYYQYQRGNGNNNVDSVFATVSHYFGEHTQVSASAGGTRSSGQGAVIYPIAVNVNGVNEIIFALVRYHTTNYLPYFALSASKEFKHTSLVFQGTEAVTPGNGQFLTSRSLSLGGEVVRQLRRSNLSIGAFFNHIGSVSSGFGTSAADTRGIDASYSYNLRRHLGVNVRYDYLNFSQFGSYDGRGDSRFTFGFYLESKDIPIGLL
jgi:uncharacterized protein YaaQ